MAHLILDLEIPDADLANRGEESLVREFRSAAVAKWYELGLVSQSRGAELLGVGREDFLQLLARYDVPAIQVHPGALDDEFRA